MSNPRVSVVICCYNMNRELPRTLLSLSSAMQRGIDAADYEIIVVDNGSSHPVDETSWRSFGTNTRLIRMDDATQSPARAMNRGIAAARAPLIGAMIDGARMASPGLLAGAIRADRISRRALVITLAFHLGPKVQMQSVFEGYDQAAEDQLLQNCDWTKDGYRLFDISVLSGSSRAGWFEPIAESNALFMSRALWEEHGGFSERFSTPGGGFVNLDTLLRASQLPGIQPVTILGEATFHQVHGGVATNAAPDAVVPFAQEYETIRGEPFRMLDYRSIYVGTIDRATLPSIAKSACISDERRRSSLVQNS
jgi:hypothetical protein